MSIETKHRCDAIELWIIRGLISHDDLMRLAGIAYENEAKQDAMTNEDDN